MQTSETDMTVAALRQAREGESGRVQILDVRSASEFGSGHLPGAINVPMEQIESRIEDLDRSAALVLVCQSGKRASMCREWLRARGVECQVLQGGTNAWADAGLPLVRCTRSRWPIERQVRLGAGLLTLTGALLAAFVHPAWVGLCAFVGLGLSGSGLTGFCPMASVLAAMPWNR
jgi:rhodanese-related sulfurtransferase